MTLFSKPIQLLEYSKLPGERRAQFRIKEDAVRLLEKIDCHVVVIGAVGQYRKGKSYILNRIADLTGQKAFEVGSTIEAVTTGIWITCLPDTKDTSRCYLLLDTQGFDDINDDDAEYTRRVFLTLLTLISCTVIFNAVGVASKSDLMGIYDGVKFAQCLQAEPMPSRQGRAASLIFLLRDFSLTLTVGGSPVTDEQYLEFMLDKGGEVERVAIRKHFVCRKMVTMPDCRSSDVQTKITGLKQAVFNKDFSGAFTIDSVTASGRVWSDILRRAVRDINSGTVPRCGQYQLIAVMENILATFRETVNTQVHWYTLTSTANSAYETCRQAAILQFQEQTQHMATDEDINILRGRLDAVINESKERCESFRNGLLLGSAAVGGLAATGFGAAFAMRTAVAAPEVVAYVAPAAVEIARCALSNLPNILR